MHRKLQNIGHEGHMHDATANAQNAGQEAYENAAQHAKLPIIMLRHLGVSTSGAILFRSLGEHIIGNTQEKQAKDAVKQPALQKFCCITAQKGAWHGAQSKFDGRAHTHLLFAHVAQRT